MPLHSDYEVSSEGAVRHWELPYLRSLITPPVETDPVAAIGAVVLNQVCGTCLSIDLVDTTAIVDFTPSMVYYQSVRSVLTYVGAAENTWRVINIGDVVYFDDSATMPAADFLSLSPLNNLGTANPVFGWVVPVDAVDMALFPKGIAIAPGSSSWCAVMQKGA